MNENRNLTSQKIIANERRKREIRFTLRLPEVLLEKIDDRISQRSYAISRNTVIIQILEKELYKI